LGAYSYSKYDDLGRPVEAGESLLDNGQDFLSLASESESFSFPSANRREVTYTYYSAPHPWLRYRGQSQRYLRERVSYAVRDGDGDLETLRDQSTTVYSYDPHGNVEWLIQEVPGLGPSYLKYRYDLVSGNVREVVYNEHRADRFHHRYSYDPDTRLVLVETSRDGEVWDRDQRQRSRSDGRLLPTRTGHDRSQQPGDADTAQGWLKALNPEDFVKNQSNEAGYLGDAYSMSLHYYQGDYENESWAGSTAG